ncbi:uncharacterized protein PV09_07429 [Verruconis gallopava]|uniref:Uncharacterized protein n=1 Tax=Verruconis gallopava TaxID=253628 RepID=A0A0D2A2Z6_9PEZI|nr:uncharacterized protein PV09_07429 [Verruconis gallopava]KIW01143.1 hypothetical protein PV09_07429 [Verruconis gallopava]
MASYFVTGVSRGIGFEFLRQLSSNPDNVVIGMARDKAATEAKVSKEFPRKNIHILQGDLSDYASLKQAADKTAEITGGSLDYLIANAADLVGIEGIPPLGVLGQNPKLLEQQLLRTFKVNVIGNIHLVNLFMPLILNGNRKKVIHLATGLSDDDMTRKYGFDSQAAYSISKSAANTAMAKFSTEYAQDGVLFLNLSPGMVDSGNMDLSTEEAQKAMAHMVSILKRYDPNFSGPITVEQSVKAMMAVYEKASVENGDSGAFLSHHGNKRWI